MAARLRAQFSLFSVTFVHPMDELGRLAAWYLPGGPVGPTSWQAATSNLSMSNDLLRQQRKGGDGGERRERGTISQRGGEGRREWNGREGLWLGKKDSTWIFCKGPRVPSYTTADGAGLLT